MNPLTRTQVNKRVLPLLTYTGYTYEKVACPYIHAYVHVCIYRYIYIMYVYVRICRYMYVCMYVEPNIYIYRYSQQ